MSFEVRRGDGRVVYPSARRLSQIDAVRTFLSTYDFSPMRRALTNNPLPWDHRWSEEHALFAEQMYRRWLLLCRIHENERISPTYDIDGFWHAHILDTDSYTEVCESVFGYILPHNGGFGGASPQEAAELVSSFDRTRIYYQQHFGEPLYEQELDSPSL